MGRNFAAFFCVFMQQIQIFCIYDIVLFRRFCVFMLKYNLTDRYEKVSDVFVSSCLCHSPSDGAEQDR